MNGGATYTSYFDVADVQRIEIETKDGNDTVVYDNLLKALSVDIQGGVDTDTIWLDGVAAGSNMTINTGNGPGHFRVGHVGAGADIQITGGMDTDELKLGETLYAGDTRPRQTFLGKVDLDGVGGDDRLSVSNAEDLDFENLRIRHPGGGEMSFSSDVKDFTLNARFYDPAEPVNELRLQNVWGWQTITINEYENLNPSFPRNSGPLTIKFAPKTGNLGSVAANIRVDAVGDDDRMIFYDSSSEDRRSYRTDTRSDYWQTEIKVDRLDDPFGPDARYLFNEVRHFEIQTSGAGSRVSLADTPFQSSWNIIGGSGDDELRSAESIYSDSGPKIGGLLDALSQTNITFDGNSGTNTVSLDDTSNTVGSFFRFLDDQQTLEFLPGYTSSLTYASDTEITIGAGSGDDEFRILGIADDVTVSLYGGDGNDEFILGDPTEGDLDSDLPTNLEIYGQGGDFDKLRLNDPNDNFGNDQYYLDKDRFRKSEQGGNVDLEPSIEYETIEQIYLKTADQFSNDVIVAGLEGYLEIAADRTVATATDTLQIGTGELSPLAGEVRIRGNGVRQVLFDDRNSTSNLAYTVQSNQLKKTQFGRNLQVKYSPEDVTNVTVFGGPNHRGLEVLSTDVQQTTVIHTGGGNVLVGGGDYAANIEGPVTVNGNAAGGTLTIDDSDVQAGTRIVLLLGTVLQTQHEDLYTFASTTFEKATVRKVKSDTIDTTEFAASPPLDFHSVAEVTLEASVTTGIEFPDRPATTVTIDSVVEGTTLTVNGNAGNDRFVIANGDYDDNIKGPVRLFGGLGEDEVEIDDSADTRDNEHYIFRDGSQGTEFLKEYAGSPITVTTEIQGADTIQLEGSNEDNVFEILALRPETKLTVLGNDGDDDFEIDVAGLRSDVKVSGGSHSLGDTLLVRNHFEPGAVYEPDPFSTRSGVIRNLVHDGGASKVSFSGIEPLRIRDFTEVTMVTPRSLDILDAQPSGDGGILIGGQSIQGPAQPVPGSPSPSLLPFEYRSLNARNVGRIVVDARSRDQLPIVNNPFYYPPFPGNELIQVHPDAMSAEGLTELAIVAGLRASQIVDRTLEGTPTEAQLTVEGLPGLTQVTITGSAPDARLKQLPGGHVDLELPTAGDRVRNIDLNFIKNLDLPGPWERLTAVGDDVDRTFFGTGTQQIAGAGLTPVQVTPSPGDAVLEIVAGGTSRVDLDGIAFAGLELSDKFAGPQPEPPGTPPDNVTVNIGDGLLFAGPQPEPPHVPIHGFDPQDRLVFEGLSDSPGSPQATEFTYRGYNPLTADVELLVTPRVSRPPTIPRWSSPSKRMRT